MDTKIEVAYLPIWRRYRSMFQEARLTDAQKGKLLGYMMDYQFDGMEPQGIPRSLLTAWAFIKKDMDDARAKYEVAVRNGRKGGRPRKTDEKETKPLKTQDNPEKGISIPISIPVPRSIPISIPNINTRSAPAGEPAGVGGEKKSYGEFGWIKLSESQYQDLAGRMGEAELKRCITHVDELAQSTGNRNRWKDWHLLLRRCHEQQWHISRRSQSREIPCGASGELGEAELEAIRQVLAESSGGKTGDVRCEM